MSHIPKKRLAVSISTWFYIPEQGMASFEILCRASAFLVRSRSAKYPHKFHILTASHVIAPWRYPKYYPDDWLQYVNQNHTRYTVEIRDENGHLTNETPLISNSVHHHTRDLAVLHLDDEDDALELFEMEGLESQDILTRDLIEGESLQFHGHDVAIPSALDADNGNTDNGTDNGAGNGIDNGSVSRDLRDGLDNTEKEEKEGKRDEAGIRDVGEDGEKGEGEEGGGIGDGRREEGELEEDDDTRMPKPQLIHGTFFSKTAHQVFARTNPILTYGMCGGPVTARSSSTLTASGVSKTVITSSVCGLLEGIVPMESTNVNIRGLAAFVDSAIITEFLSDVEMGPAHALSKGHTRLRGGDKVGEQEEDSQ